MTTRTYHDYIDMNKSTKKDYSELKAAHDKLHEQFQQLQDEIEGLEKSNDVLWKVVAFLMENIDGKR